MRDVPVIFTLAAGILITTLLLVAGCTSAGSAPAPEKKELTVFAAASLSGAMTDIATAYEAVHPDTKIVLNFDGSQALRTQIEQGARADLFLSANTKQMAGLQGEGLIVNDSVRVFARNKLALLVPIQKPGKYHRSSGSLATRYPPGDGDKGSAVRGLHPAGSREDGQ